MGAEFPASLEKVLPILNEASQSAVASSLSADATDWFSCTLYSALAGHLRRSAFLFRLLTRNPSPAYLV